MIEKVLFKKIEMWLAAVIFLFSFGCVFFIGCYGYMRPNSFVGNSVREMMKSTRMISDLFKGNLKITGFEVENKFKKKQGYVYKEKNNKNVFIFNSRFNEENKASVVEYVSIKKNSSEVKWSFNIGDKHIQSLNIGDVKNKFFAKPSADDDKMASLRLEHPVPSLDGGVILKTHQGAIFKVDICGDIVWVNNEFAYHHSTEIDEEGNIYVPGNIPFDNKFFDNRVMDDHLVILDRFGKIKFKKSIFDILRDNGIHNRIYTYDRPEHDFIHLNDIQPVLSDGKYWRKGDVFLSLGHLSMVMLYRPSSNKVVWFTQDNIFHQHDVDIINEYEISIFNNNRTTGYVPGSGKFGLDYAFKHNEIVIYNFKDNEFKKFHSDLFKQHNIKTISQGLIDFNKDGDFLVEETNYGRLLFFNSSGDLEWEFFNSSGGEQYYSQNWSRLIDEDAASLLNENLKKISCESKSM